MILFGTLLLKTQKMTRYPKSLGRHDPFGPRGYAYDIHHKRGCFKSKALTFPNSGKVWGAVRKILYLTDLAQKLLSLRIFSYLCD